MTFSDSYARIWKTEEFRATVATSRRIEGVKMKAIIFDMDGVIFDTERLSASVMKEVGAEMGVVVTDQFIQSQCSASPADYLKSMRLEFGADFDAAHFDAAFNQKFPLLLAQGVPEKPGVRELIQAAKERDFKLAVASSTRYERVRTNLEEAGIFFQFDAVFGGDLVSQSKPNPEIYQKAAAALNLPPEECFAIEDSRNGVRSASSAGCKTIMVPDLTPPDDELRELTFAICSSLLEVIPLL